MGEGQWDVWSPPFLEVSPWWWSWWDATHGVWVSPLGGVPIVMSLLGCCLGGGGGGVLGVFPPPPSTGCCHGLLPAEVSPVGPPLGCHPWGMGTGVSPGGVGALHGVWPLGCDPCDAVTGVPVVMSLVGVSPIAVPPPPHRTPLRALL